jgi:hypothetical protein
MTTDSELFPAGEPRWAVLTCYKHQSRAERLARIPKEVSHHELLFGTKVELRRKGEAGLEVLREMAKFLNRRELLPRPRVQCAADAPNPEAYLRKNSP